MRVIGVDPGSLATGYGIIEAAGSKLRYVSCGTIRCKSTWLFADRLLHIYEGLSQSIAQFKPQVMVVESVFHAKNSQTALKLGQARGVALLAGAQNQLAIHEYTPREIKKGIVSYGGASKDQVQRMVCLLLGQKLEVGADATDALAAALYHLHRNPSRIQKQTQSKEAQA